MKKIILYLLIVVLYSNCKAQQTIAKTINSKSDSLKVLKDKNNDSIYLNNNLCKTLNKINIKDQLYRTNETNPFLDVAYKTLDSIYNSRGMSFFSDGSGRPVGVKLPIIEQKKIGKLASNIVYKNHPEFLSKNWKKRNDSLMQKQILLDNKNTELLINIVEKIGYPNKDNCDCDEEILKSLIVFRHSQIQYFDKIRILIEQEHKAKRLPDGKYKMFLDHINGRTGKDLK